MSASSIQFILVLVIPTDKRVQRIMLATPQPEPMREPEEVFLVDRIQHHGGRTLDDPRIKMLWGWTVAAACILSVVQTQSGTMR